jgi:hypothetical protein
MRALFLLALATLPAIAADVAFQRAWNKLERIESGSAKPGSVIVFTPSEMNAWARERVPQMFDGIRDPRIQFGDGTATAFAMVDFLKMRQGEGTETNPLLAKFIEGERPLKVSVRLVSSGGHATAYLTGVEVSGVTASGPLLDTLVNWFFQPLFPDAKINQPFELPDGVERIDMRPDGVRVTIKR